MILAYYCQQNDIRILRSGTLELYSKLEVLNRELKIIDVMTSSLISDSFSNDSDSDIRRTYQCELHVMDSRWFTGREKLIWMDKYIRPYTGLKDQRTGEITWYLMGTYRMSETSYHFDETANTLSLSCCDLMSTLNGDHGGRLEGESLKIEEGNDVRKVMIDLLTQSSVVKYSICEIPYTIPYDLEFNANITCYEILKEIIDLYPGYEMFFDINGIFTIQKIPSCENDPLILDNNIFKQFVIEESNHSTSFKDIYNHVQVWGQTIDVDGLADSSSYANNTYTASITSVTKLESFKTYGIHIASPNTSDGTKLNISGLGAKKIMIDEKKPITKNYITSSGDYAFKYRRASDDFLFLGQYQVFGEAYDTNPQSPFTIENLGYELLYVCSGGDYEKIYTDDLAAQRARYEIYQHTNLQQRLELTMITIPWLDVNQLIEYQSKNSETIVPYIIKSISGSTSEATMQINLVRFYPEYPETI